MSHAADGVSHAADGVSYPEQGSLSTALRCGRHGDKLKEANRLGLSRYAVVAAAVAKVEAADRWAGVGARRAGGLDEATGWAWSEPAGAACARVKRRTRPLV